MNLNNIDYWGVLLSFISACLISYLSVPPIVTLAKAKMLCALPNGRTSHQGAVPTLGGIAIFAGFIISALLFSSYIVFPPLPFITAGCLIIFFSGLKDDIFIISPYSKIATQIFASATIIYFADIRITNFHGFLGINEISYIYSFLITIFVFIVIINSYNLIDGIDGLASVIGIVSSFAFGIWFFLTQHFQYAVLCFALAGSLVGFLRFNLSKKQYKIFMGDTGSLLVGFVIAVLVIQFNEFNLLTIGKYKIESAPAVSIAVLILPLYDTLRLMIVRVMRKQSPFKADRGHIHHKLLDLGYTHIQATIILSVFTIVFIFIAYQLQYIGILWLTLILFILATLLYLIPITLILRKLKMALLSPSKNVNKVNETNEQFLTEGK